METMIEDYKIDEWEDDDLMWKIKTALTLLRPVERTIFMTFVEGGTYTSVAKAYGVSVPTARTYILRIKEKIMKLINGEE